MRPLSLLTGGLLIAAALYAAGLAGDVAGHALARPFAAAAASSAR